MKKLAIAIISFYQIVFSPLLKQVIGVRRICRLTPSCSQYSKKAIEKYGLKKGIKMGLIRILHCQPFSMSTRVSHLSEVQGMAEGRSSSEPACLTGAEGVRRTKMYDVSAATK